MFRKPTSTMTAVEIVSAQYDGPIPAEVLMQARAEDVRFAAEHPNHCLPSISQIDESRLMVKYFANKVHELIKAKRASDANGIVNSAWRPSLVAQWFMEWRRERRQLARLIASWSRSC